MPIFRSRYCRGQRLSRARQKKSGSHLPLSVPKIFRGQSSQVGRTRATGTDPVHIDKPYYTALTDQLLDHFYPKTCCGQTLSAVDGKRDTVLRCPRCHKQQTRLAGTPLNHLKVPRWMFGYLLKESQLQFPKVLTSAEIGRRVGVSGKTAILLKRRIQLFAMDILPRMQRKFYQDNKLMFHDFRFPRDRETDLSAMVKDKPIPQADTVVLYSCSSAANKGRKRYKRTGQTASIYMSESLGGKQRGTLVSTLGVKQGPVFFDSVPNQKAETITPILGKYIPIHTPLFTDEGYKFWPGRNHRSVNHSRKSPDKRFKWSRNRWSKNGVHCNVAEGNNGVIKQAFSTYRWIDPKHSKLYTGEFSVLGNLRYFALDDLLPEVTARKPSPTYKLDENWDLRGMSSNLIHGKSARVKHRLSAHEYEANSLIEIHRRESLTERAKVDELINRIENLDIRRRIKREQLRLAAWSSSQTTKDQRRKQRYFQALSEKAWRLVPADGYIEVHDLALRLKMSGKHVFRLMAIWCRTGLIDCVRLNRETKAKHVEYFDMRRMTDVLPPLVYVVPQNKLAGFNASWRRRTRGIV